jgi:tetratricopeptide (TPR) repeat protein
MLKARKKITHKELKKDKLVTTYFNVKNWFEKPENRKKVGMAAGIVAVLVIAVFLYISNRRTKNEEAEAKLSLIVNLYQQGKYQEAINGDAATSTPGLNEIVANYGSTNAGQTAKYFLANCFYNIKDYDNALKYFDDYSGNNDFIKASCISGMAAVYEAKGDMNKAAEYYEKSAAVNKDVFMNPDCLYSALRIYTQLGDKESAQKIYKHLKDEYPKSKYIAESKKLESLFSN